MTIKITYRHNGALVNWEISGCLSVGEAVDAWQAWREFQQGDLVLVSAEEV